MTPQRRSALVSVAAAATLVVLKLSIGLATHSLGLLSEAAHSGTDLVAALLTFFAVGVSGRPADTGHQYGHGKAEHLSALGEAAILVLVSLVIGWRAILRLTGGASAHVDAAWYAGGHRLPRRSCSRSIASNSALKLPLPKLRAPLRSMIS